MKTICFTGHRPNKLGGYDWNTPKNKVIIEKLRSEIISLINSTREYDFKFICGGALGIDQMAFDILEKLKYGTLHLNNLKMTLELAIPFSKQPIKWNYHDAKKYEIQKSQADIVTYVDRLEDYKIKGYDEDIYYPAKMQKRNQYMVDNSDVIIAVWDGTKGGTANCVSYAKKLGKEIISINPKEIIK